MSEDVRIDVRNSGGMRLGDLRLHDARALLRGVVRFARATDTRYFGTGFREIPTEAADLSFATLDLRVSEWVEPPTIGANGGYRSGRCDYILLYDGPIEALHDLRADFRPA